MTFLFRKDKRRVLSINAIICIKFKHQYCLICSSVIVGVMTKAPSLYI